MPPSLRDWVPEGHLVWTVLDAVAELDLSAIYADYRADGRGRPAYEPSMMVALLLYAYARGNRSSRGIERACVEDVAYRVVTGNLAPDHSTIAEFRCRHEQPLGEVFSGVLGLCARAGLASVGVVAIDGTKMAANASSDRQPRLRSDRARDPRRGGRDRPRARTSSTGPSAATSCPSSCAPARVGAGRCARPSNAWSANATSRTRRRLTASSRWRSSSIRASSSRARRVVGRGCARGAARWTPSASARRARSPKDRTDRLFEACRRLEQELDVEHASHAAYDAWRARGVAADGSRRMAPGMVKPHEPVLGAGRADQRHRP